MLCRFDGLYDDVPIRVQGQWNYPMDMIDHKILNEIQSRLPLVSRPFRSVARKLGVPESEVIRRVKVLERNGIIRRIGATLHSEAFGYEGMLVAAQVPARRVGRFAKVVKEFPEVTHCYEREGTYNVWFTVQAPSNKRTYEIVKICERETGCRLLRFPSRKRFKIYFKIYF